MRELLALLDFGSNAARFVLASVKPGRGFRVLREDRVQTRLAAGRGRRLPVRSIEATVEATRRFLRHADTGRPIRVVAVATGAVRDAANAHRLAAAIRAVAGVDIEVLDWKEEAALGAAAAMTSLPARDALVVDVGGASVQATRVHHGAITPLASAPLGAVRASRLFRHDPPAAREILTLRRQVGEALGGTTVGLARHTSLIALGGTARALGRIHLAARRSSRGVHGLRLERDVVTALCGRLQDLSLRRRRRLPGLRRGSRRHHRGRRGGARRAVEPERPARVDGVRARRASRPVAARDVRPRAQRMTSRFVNRELSWLEFNRRVLEEAQDDSVPLLERVKFLAIVSSNLDEFFMVRVADLKRRVRDGDTSAGADGLTPAETLATIATEVQRLGAEQHRCFLFRLEPMLTAEGVRLVRPRDVTPEQAKFLASYFERTVLPVVTPLAIDPGHPFPHLANGSLCLVVTHEPAVHSPLPHARLSVLHIPTIVPRFVALPAEPGRHAFMLLEDVIRLHLGTLYSGYTIHAVHAIRVTRDADLRPARARPDDLLTSVEQSLRERRMGSAVRLQYDGDLPADVLTILVDELELAPSDLYEAEGFIAFADLFQLYAAVDEPRLKAPAFVPRAIPPFERAPDVWSAIRAGDVLVHHPYQSFDAVTRFVEEAADDPRVLAIKMTLYRVSPASPIARALTRAAERGKEVAVLVELQARFDEEANIRWARALEKVGAHVVYGLVGVKTHCKACLVVRQEEDGIRRYCHLATGNYNVRTAGIYGDLGLFTCRETFGEDLTALFNLVTGYTRPERFHHLLVAPIHLRDALVARVRREAEHARSGRAARLVVKVNSLVDQVLIDELYAASQAGVDVDLIVRGICCLRPGVPGLSERIRAISVIDRFLEHARVFAFDNDGDPEYWLASADWMPRNLDRRVEVAFPVLDPALQAQIRQILDIQLADTVKARVILPDGRCRRIDGDGRPGRSQEEFYALAGAVPRC